MTPATIRKDLTRLEESGRIRRVHGGAISLAGSANLELTSQEKDGIHAGKKQDIDRRACKYIKPGQVTALAWFGDLEQIHTLVTDKDADPGSGNAAGYGCGSLHGRIEMDKKELS